MTEQEIPDRLNQPHVSASRFSRNAVGRIKSCGKATPDSIGPLHISCLSKVMLLEEHDAAARFYQQAVAVAAADNRLGELASVRANLELLRSAGVTADPETLDRHLGSVITFSGHMVDSPERMKAGHPPRFPNSAELIAAVSAAIAKVLDQVNAVVCGRMALHDHNVRNRSNRRFDSGLASS